jgi:hypothetical protein
MDIDISRPTRQDLDYSGRTLNTEVIHNPGQTLGVLAACNSCPGSQTRPPFWTCIEYCLDLRTGPVVLLIYCPFISCSTLPCSDCVLIINTTNHNVGTCIMTILPFRAGLVALPLLALLASSSSVFSYSLSPLSDASLETRDASFLAQGCLHEPPRSQEHLL